MTVEIAASKSEAEVLRAPVTAMSKLLMGIQCLPFADTRKLEVTYAYTILSSDRFITVNAVGRLSYYHSASLASKGLLVDASQEPAKDHGVSANQDGLCSTADDAEGSPPSSDLSLASCSLSVVGCPDLASMVCFPTV
jgi:hypothetical protein